MRNYDFERERMNSILEEVQNNFYDFIGFKSVEQAIQDSKEKVDILTSRLEFLNDQLDNQAHNLQNKIEVLTEKESDLYTPQIEQFQEQLTHIKDLQLAVKMLKSAFGAVRWDINYSFSDMVNRLNSIAIRFHEELVPVEDRNIREIVSYLDLEDKRIPQDYRYRFEVIRDHDLLADTHISISAPFIADIYFEGEEIKIVTPPDDANGSYNEKTFTQVYRANEYLNKLYKAATADTDTTTTTGKEV